MARLTEAQRRKAREEFDRRRRDHNDSQWTAGSSFDAFLATYVATDGFGSGAFDSGSSYDSSSSSCDTSSSYSDSSSSYSDGGSSSCDAGGGGF